MSIKEINPNGRSKIIAHHTSVLQAPKNGHTGSKANVSAPSHNTRPIVNQGHANNPQTNRKGPSGRGPTAMSNDGASDNEGRAHEAAESKGFESGEDSQNVSTRSKVVKDRTSGGKGMTGSY